MSLKRSFLCVIAVLALLILAIGCSKSSPAKSSSGSLSATIGNTAFTASIAAGFYSQSFGLIGVTGQAIQLKDTSEILLEFPYPPLLNHTISSDTVVGIGLTYTLPGKEYDGYRGQGHVILTISTGDTVNHALAGTFSGVVYNDANLSDSIIVTDGKFSAGYTVSP